MRRILHILLICTCGFIALPALATEAKEGEGVNVPELIFEHIGDSYEWHIAGKCTIPLPCILIDKSGITTFMSSQIKDGAECDGYHIAAEGNYAGKIVNARGERPFDISITKNVLQLFIVCGTVCAVFLLIARWYKRNGYKKAPGGFVGLMEVIVGFVETDVIKSSIGHGYEKFSYYLLTLFFFILTTNIFGLVPVFPGGANLTGNIAVTATLAVTSFIAINCFAPKAYYKSIFWPDVPLFLKAIPLMPLIEFVGVFTKPFSLTIRLFANILAGHIMILALTCLIFISQPMGAALNGSMTAVGVAFSVFMNCLEMLVAFIQAYVFTMLTATFIGMAHNE